MAVGSRLDSDLSEGTMQWSTAFTCTMSVTSLRPTHCANRGRSMSIRQKPVPVRSTLHIALDVNPRLLLSFEDALTES